MNGKPQAYRTVLRQSRTGVQQTFSETLIDTLD